MITDVEENKATVISQLNLKVALWSYFACSLLCFVQVMYEPHRTGAILQDPWVTGLWGNKVIESWDHKVMV